MQKFQLSLIGQVLVCCLVAKKAKSIPEKLDNFEVWSHLNAHLNDLPVKFSVCVNEGQDKLRRPGISTEELTKCYEPLQKLRVRLWPCKIDLNPLVTLCY